MSRGPGRIQKAIAAALHAEPGWRFTANDMAVRIFPEDRIDQSKLSSIHRALNAMAADFGLTKINDGTQGYSGCRQVWVRQGNTNQHECT